MELNGMRMKALLVSHILLCTSFLLLPPHVQCADKDDSVAPSFYTQEIYKELEGLTTALTKDIKADLDFCIKDVYVLYYIYS